MMPFQLTVLGHPELHGPDGDPLRFRTRKHFGLLLYLAVEPSVHRRDRLATLLWPGTDIEEARHSLATALSVLRAKLGADTFDAQRDTVRMLPGRVVTDLERLDRDDAADVAGDMLGPFLEEFELADAGDFEQWKDAHRARLTPVLHAIMARRIEYARTHGDSRRMEAIAHRLVRIDPLSEAAARALLESRAMAGDRIGALRLYDRWRAQLYEQLGARPSLQVERLADRLRRSGWDRIGGAAIAPIATEQWKDRVFVGRGTEFRACYDAWERVRNGEARHVLVRGESGIGKTTLLERFVTTISLEGASVARVQCYELERELPFGVIGGLVNPLLDLPGASATPPEQLAELGVLVATVGNGIRRCRRRDQAWARARASCSLKA